MNETDYSRRKDIPSLVDLAISECSKNIQKLEHVGYVPFNLIRPLLKRMNHKQLANIEEKCPHLVPDSDEIWSAHISKEFPERPSPSHKMIKEKKYNLNNCSTHTGTFAEMPNKSLFYKYMHEREAFRNDTAERLRNMTERLRREKSENSIVSVPELLRDPTVKRNRPDPSFGYMRISRPNRNSILNRARKDLQNRALMFPRYKQNVAKYDQYVPFHSSSTVKNEKTPQNRISSHSNEQFRRDHGRTHKREMYTAASHICDKKENGSNTTSFRSTRNSDLAYNRDGSASYNNQAYMSEPKTSSEHISRSPKRKPEQSIFLTHPRRKKRSEAEYPKSKRIDEDLNVKHPVKEEIRKPTIKSSIFS